MKRSTFALFASLFLAALSGVAVAAPAAPYGLDKRPVPAKSDEATLLPEKVGSFKRGDVDGKLAEDDEVYATYKSGEDEVILTVSVTKDVAEAQEGVETAKDVMNESAEKPFKSPVESLKTDPAFFQVIEEDVAFMAWSHGKFFFTVDASDGEKAVLEQFMKAFPY